MNSMKRGIFSKIYISTTVFSLFTVQKNLPKCLKGLIGEKFRNEKRRKEIKVIFTGSIQPPFLHKQENIIVVEIIVESIDG